VKCVNSVVIQVCYHAVEEWLFTADNEFLEMCILPVKDAWLIVDMKVCLFVYEQRERNYAGDCISKQTVFFELLDLRNNSPLCRDKLVVVYTIYSNPLSSRRHRNCLLNCCSGGRARVMYQVCSL